MNINTLTLLAVSLQIAMAGEIVPADHPKSTVDRQAVVERVAFFTEAAMTCRAMIEQEKKDMWTWQKAHQCKGCEPNESTCHANLEHAFKWQQHAQRLKDLAAKVEAYERTCRELTHQNTHEGRD